MSLTHRVRVSLAFLLRSWARKLERPETPTGHLYKGSLVSLPNWFAGKPIRIVDYNWALSAVAVDLKPFSPRPSIVVWPISTLRYATLIERNPQ